MSHNKDEFQLLTPVQRTEIENQLLSGIVDRSVMLFAVFAIGSIFYGFQTFEILKKFNGELTLFENVFPRVLYSTIPCLFFILLQKKLSNLKLKLLIWAIGFPLIYFATCLINVWPLIYQGHEELYLYFHAANMFCITLSFLVVAPNIKYFSIQLATFIVTFFTPVYFLVHHQAAYISLIINDSISSVCISFFSAYFLFNLRKKIAVYELKFKNQITPFLGSNLVQAIYTEKLDTFKNFKALGIILSIDLRGYTSFLQSQDEELVSAYMEKYHSLVTKIFCNQGGHLHKSNGDGHIFSFGVMDEIDLSDLSSIKNEIIEADQNKIKSYSEKIHETFSNFVAEFQQLNADFQITSNLQVGAAAAIGEVKLKLQGDQGTKMELDIEGEVIVKVSRLEAYTKVLGMKISTENSYLIFTEEIADLTRSGQYKMWSTVENGLQIRDFSQIKKIFYRAWPTRFGNSYFDRRKVPRAS